MRAMLLGMGALSLSACGPRVGGDAGFRVDWSAVWRVGDRVNFMAAGGPACDSEAPITPFPEDCTQFQQLLDAIGLPEYGPSFGFGTRNQLTSLDNYEWEGGFGLGHAFAHRRKFLGAEADLDLVDFYVMRVEC